MNNPVTLAIAWDKMDAIFFQKHHFRRSRIRRPWAVSGVTECEAEFRTLGSHERGRRRIMLWRVTPDHPSYETHPNSILKIPFVAFADETIEDTDEVLLPIIENIMREAAL